MRRKPTRKPTRARKTRRPSPPAPPAPPSAAGEADPLADARIRPLLERYCKLAKVKHAAVSPDHSELILPETERAFFRDRHRLSVAFSLEALERDPDAEIAVLGSPFLSQLIEAIRARAARLSLGLIAAAPDVVEGKVELPVAVRDGVAKKGKTRVAVHPIGRLVARVVLRAGAGVEEAVVESDVFDLSVGATVDADLAAAFGELEAGRPPSPEGRGGQGVRTVPAREPADLLRLLLSHLQEKSAERVAARRAVAEQQLAVELGRLDRYFESMLKDQADAEGIGAVTALAERRRTEEIRRSQVKAVVHPLQLIEATVLIERAEWQVTSNGHTATFSAHRSLGEWIMVCPRCGRPPATLVVCRHAPAHGACDACSSRCSVCAEDFCADHGIAQCRVDEQPVCEEHARVCQSCRMAHCSTHEGVCAEGDHPACTACLAACGSCGRVVCNRHAEQARADAPKGSRRLCTACVRQCEGGNETVGLDEVTECATCGKSVCTAHQAVCAIDGAGQVHCSKHLRRTDASRRLVCAEHRGACAYDEAEVFAADEVEECPICGKDACAGHRAACGYCGRHVCTADLRSVDMQPRRCVTCAELAVVSVPPDAVVAAALKVANGQPKSSRRWRMARDRSHLVLELDQGLTRKTVFTLRHGSDAPDSVVKHSLMGSKQRK